MTFNKEFIEEIATAVVAKLPKPPGGRWPELMDIKAAAEYMGRTPGGIRGLIQSKILPCCKIDDRVQIRKVDMDRVIERHTS